MFDPNETAQRLSESLATIEWAVSAIPPRFTHELPDFYPEGEWGVAMNLAHLVVYEEEIANPVLAALAAGGDGVGSVRSAMEGWFLNDALAIAGEPIDALLGRLKAARGRQIEMVESFAAERFNAPMTPLWASGRHGTPPHSAGWVATKTFQHTWEHGNAVLRMALFAPR